MSTTTPLRCKCRRHAETSLRCARCDTPICPNCSVPYSAGMMCRDCGSASRSPLYQVPVGRLMVAILACLAVATLGGWLLASVGGLGFFSLWIGFLYGLGIAEVALRVTGRKRGLQMEIVAGGCAALGVVAGWFLSALLHGGPAMMLYHLMNPFAYILIIVAVVAAVGRIRNI